MKLQVVSSHIPHLLASPLLPILSSTQLKNKIVNTIAHKHISQQQNKAKHNRTQQNKTQQNRQNTNVMVPGHGDHHHL
jgi:hypothetical protein